MTDLAVIISVYYNDRLQFVSESIESILNQTFSDFHLYIILDGKVKPEVNSYITEVKDKRVKLYSLEKNFGLAGALNFLLMIVLKNPFYELIARMDADDISMPDRFEKQRTFLKDNKNVSVVGSWYQEIDESGKHISNRKLPLCHKELKKRFFTRTPFAHPSVMYRKSLIETVGNYPTDTNLMEDNVLWGKALSAGMRFANIPEYLLKFRIDSNFFNRRSGIKYGWNYIITRFKINKSLYFSYNFYLLSIMIGLLKMMPSFVLRYFSMTFRRFS